MRPSVLVFTAIAFAVRAITSAAKFESTSSLGTPGRERKRVERRKILGREKYHPCP